MFERALFGSVDEPRGAALDPIGEPRPRANPARHGLDGGEHEGIERDREQRAREDQVAPFRRQQPERHAEPGEDERELADLREARRHGERRARSG